MNGERSHHRPGGSPSIVQARQRRHASSAASRLSKPAGRGAVAPAVALASGRSEATAAATRAVSRRPTQRTVKLARTHRTRRRRRRGSGGGHRRARPAVGQRRNGKTGWPARAADGQVFAQQHSTDAPPPLPPVDCVADGVDRAGRHSHLTGGVKDPPRHPVGPPPGDPTAKPCRDCRRSPLSAQCQRQTRQRDRPCCRPRRLQTQPSRFCCQAQRRV